MVTVMSEKEEFIRLSKVSGTKMSELCLEFGISRTTGYKWLNRYAQDVVKGLQEHSRRPHFSPHKTKAELEVLILNARSSHPSWGGAKIKEYLQNLGQEQMPSEKTVDRILKRYGCINPEESAKHKGFIRFEHENPNDLWQMDFKGHFALSQGTRCHPLTLLDDHSRFSLLIQACADEQSSTVKQALITVFRTHGIPRQMTMDNGSPWGYSGNQRYTTLSAWLIRLGIQVSHSRPSHPQTQGKLERFHRTLNLELLSRYQLEDFKEAQRAFDWWRKIYNEERPHQAINFNVPKKRYCSSERPYPEILNPIEYSSDMSVRKVQAKGEIHFNGKIYIVGQGFSGQPVGIKENEKNGLLDIYFCHQKVLKIDLNNPCNYI